MANLRRTKRLPARHEFTDPDGGVPRQQSPEEMKATLIRWTLALGGKVVEREPSR